MLSCKPAASPMLPGLKLTSTDGEPLSDPTVYRRLLGRLIYLTNTRPGICFAVHKLSQYIYAPLKPNLMLLCTSFVTSNHVLAKVYFSQQLLISLSRDLVTLTGQLVLRAENQSLVSASSLVLLLYLGSPRSKILSPDLHLKLNTRL